MKYRETNRKKKEEIKQAGERLRRKQNKWAQGRGDMGNMGGKGTRTEEQTGNMTRE